MPPKRTDPAPRFWAKVGPPDANGCRNWLGNTSTTRGYGRFTPRTGESLPAHRYAWIIQKGEIPPGMFVCHVCDNPSCCEITHLMLGTPADNSADMVAKGRQCRGDRHHAKTHPENLARGDAHGRHTVPSSIVRGERAGTAKLTADEVVQIRSLHAAGKSMHSLSRDFGVCRPQIKRILNRESWAHIT